MEIRVSNSQGEIQSKHYPQQKEEQRSVEVFNDDLAKLLALKRDLMVRPAEMELISLCKSNLTMRKMVLQVRQACEADQPAEAKVKNILNLLQKH